MAKRLGPVYECLARLHVRKQNRTQTFLERVKNVFEKCQKVGDRRQRFVSGQSRPRSSAAETPCNVIPFLWPVLQLVSVWVSTRQIVICPMRNRIK